MPVYNKTCFCPSDCESTQYVFETSTAWRTPRDTSMLIKSYSKKNKLMDKVKKDIKELDALCISHEEKETRLEELIQLNKSIAYTSTMIQFFWKEDTMVSYVRDQHYTIVDMLGIIITYQYNPSSHDLINILWTSRVTCMIFLTKLAFLSFF